MTNLVDKDHFFNTLFLFHFLKSESSSVVSNSFAAPWTIQSMEFSSPEYWSGNHSLLQGIFLTQGLNPGLPHCRQILYQLSYKGSHFLKPTLNQFKIYPCFDRFLFEGKMLNLIELFLENWIVLVCRYHRIQSVFR